MNHGEAIQVASLVGKGRGGRNAYAAIEQPAGAPGKDGTTKKTSRKVPKRSLLGPSDVCVYDRTSDNDIVLIRASITVARNDNKELAKTKNAGRIIRRIPEGDIKTFSVLVRLFKENLVSPDQSMVHLTCRENPDGCDFAVWCRVVEFSSDEEMIRAGFDSLPGHMCRVQGEEVDFYPVKIKANLKDNPHLVAKSGNPKDALAEAETRLQQIVANTVPISRIVPRMQKNGKVIQEGEKRKKEDKGGELVEVVMRNGTAGYTHLWCTKILHPTKEGQEDAGYSKLDSDVSVVSASDFTDKDLTVA